jgi:uncharacterized protein
MAGTALAQPIDTILQQRFGIDRPQIIEICDRFQILEFGIFGSALRDDFRPSGDNPSDIDILIVYAPNHRATLDNWLALQNTLETLFKRKVDIIQKKLLKNPYRRKTILETNQILYERAIT